MLCTSPTTGYEWIWQTMPSSLAAYKLLTGLYISDNLINKPATGYPEASAIASRKHSSQLPAMLRSIPEYFGKPLRSTPYEIYSLDRARRMIEYEGGSSDAMRIYFQNNVEKS